MGFRPIILDRGKVVRERTRDTWGLWRRGMLNPKSTCSSAKAAPARFPTANSIAGSRIRATGPQSADRVRRRRRAGGNPDVGKPHIGTFRLVTMVENIRATIEALGGEYRFRQRVDDYRIDDGSATCAA